MMRLMLLALGLTGCQLLLGGDDAAECAQAADCPDGQTCLSGRCVMGDGVSDMRVADLPQTDPVLDMRVPLDLGDESDLAIDMAVDAAPIDAALPAELEPLFPDGRCFDGAGMVELARGDTLIPRGLCTPYGVLWTRTDPLGPQLVLSRTVPVTDALVMPIDQDGRLSTANGRFVAYRGPSESGLSVPMLVDLAARDPAPIELRPIAVTEVQRAVGATAYVHAGGVFVHPDAEDFATFVDCSAPDRHQWGVALVGTRVAWFERASRGGPAQLVLADATTCRNRIVYPTMGSVDPTERVHRVGERWVWIARGATGPAVHGLAPDARGRLRPIQIALEHRPLEIAGEGDWLIGVGYADGAYRIDALNLAENRYRPLSEGASNNRRPHVFNGQASWAAMIRQRWGVQYVVLDQ